jgi:hypothetical protein
LAGNSFEELSNHRLKLARGASRWQKISATTKRPIAQRVGFFWSLEFAVVASGAGLGREISDTVPGSSAVEPRRPRHYYLA